MTKTNDIDVTETLRTSMSPYWNPSESGGLYLIGVPNDDDANAKVHFNLLSLYPDIETENPHKWEFLADKLSDVARTFIHTYELAPGTYKIDNYWATLLEDLELEINQWDDTKIKFPAKHEFDFEVTDEHLSLMKHMNTRSYYGYVELMDCKRPYGDMTYFYIDMADALGEPIPRDENEQPAFTPEVRKRYQVLHGEMLFAVQAFWFHASKPATQ